MSVEVILFDFSGTLAEEPVLFPAHIKVPPNWRDIWNARFAEPGFADRWQKGEVTAAELTEDLSKRLDTDPATLRLHIERASKSLTFHSEIMKSVRARKRRGNPQALVTINPDLFTLVADHYSLDMLFDVVVLSAQEGTVDKVELCRIALDRLGFKDFSSALLIDNVAELVRSFELAGGTGYHFIDDATFAADVASGLLPASLAQ